MIRDWKQWEGQIVNGTFPLRQYLGGSANSAVFLTERRGREPQRAVIKLIPADPATAEVQLSRWEATAKLSHPHLLRLFESGSCQLDKVVLLYVVMEYAEDNLAQILPHRALTPAEVRDLLEPALDALTFVHGKGLVHSRLKPSNVLAAQDQLKLSSDSLLRTGEMAGVIAPPSAYDAPEIANGHIFPASDAWSLGMTVMEALTQRLPACEGIAEPLPETVPAPFMGIAHCCLRLDPQRRCTVADIATRLQSAPSSSPQPSTVRIPAGSAKWRNILLIALVVLAVAAVWLGPKLLNRGPRNQPAASVSSTPPAVSEPAATHETQSAAPETEPPATDAAKPSATKTRSERSSPRPAPPPPAPAAVSTTTSGAGSAQGSVLQQVSPVISRSAQNTISGTIRIRIKVLVDASGNVQNASIISAGPSKYFSRQAMQAAQQWKFSPGQAAARAWVLHFGFRRSGIEVASEPAKP
ncbi:MAG: TonB family protein [Terriglobales bacterium]